MGRGQQLTEGERAKIDLCEEFGLNKRQTAACINRSPGVVINYLKDPIGYGSRFSGGRPPILTPRDKQRIFAKMSSDSMSVPKLIAELDIVATKWTVTRFLNSSDIFKYKKMNKAPKLTERHRQNRLEWRPG